jgi:hypothetical protein
VIAARPLDLDAEVVEFLRDEPRLLAIADAVAVTQAVPGRGRRWPRLVVLAATLVLALVVVQLAPWRGAGAGVVERALAAIGRGPVLHAVIEARDPYGSLVDLATGKRAPTTIQIEYWFDGERGLLRSVVRRNGVSGDEIFQTARGGRSSTGPIVTLPGTRPSPNPALAAFVSGYRRALAAGAARTVGEATVDGRRVTWLELRAGGGTERVAIDAETSEPVRIRAVGPDGSASPYVWRVRAIETRARRAGDFTPPAPAAAPPFRGDVQESRAVSSDQARIGLAWPAVWLGESFQGLRLESIALQQLTRGYPPASRRPPTRGHGLELRYGDGRRYLQIEQAPAPEPAYAFAAARSTFSGNPIPGDGEMELVELPRADLRGTGCVGQLRRESVYLTIWASSRPLCLEAARRLRPIGT